MWNIRNDVYVNLPLIYPPSYIYMYIYIHYTCAYMQISTGVGLSNWDNIYKNMHLRTRTCSYESSIIWIEFQIDSHNTNKTTKVSFIIDILKVSPHKYLPFLNFI